jgi:hypothetical protein
VSASAEAAARYQQSTINHNRRRLVFLPNARFIRIPADDLTLSNENNPMWREFHVESGLSCQIK